MSTKTALDYLPEPIDEEALTRDERAVRERRLTALAIKRAELRLKEIEKRKSVPADG